MNKKRLAFALLLAVLYSAGIFAVPVSAGGEDHVVRAGPAATKYPIVLVHGAGFRDKTFRIGYWGRIPATLEAQGARIFYGGTDGWGSIESNAAMLKKTVESVLAETGSEKVNIIAHSKGGLEARYMISSLGMAGKVASLTTISTPHHGSETIDKVMGVPDFLYKGASWVMDGIFRVFIRDEAPDFYNGSKSLAAGYMKEFNIMNPDDPGVYYQSFGGALTVIGGSILLSWTAFPIEKIEGENDGLVTVDSAKWANYRGALRGAARRGVSHADLVDIWRRDLKIQPLLGAETIREFYVAVAADLKARGY